MAIIESPLLPYLEFAGIGEAQRRVMGHFQPSQIAWTSRRRLLTTLSGGVPDRVPINTYELAGRNSRDWYNQQHSYRALMDYIRAHTDCITNCNPRAATDRYTCEERFLCSDYPV